MAQISKPFKEMFVFVMKRIGLILAAILIMVLMGGGVGVAIILRAAGLDYTGIVVPSLIVEVVACFIAYSLASSFFPKVSRDYEGGPSKKSSRSYREPEEIEAPASGDTELPERDVKS
jgi:hypothetical protein